MQSDKSRQMAYKDRMRAKGLELVAVWIPATDKDKHAKYVAKLRKQANLALRYD